MLPSDFIAALGPAATAVYQATGVWASVTIAQGALESGWGSSALAQRGFNLFGIKADPAWHGPTIAYQTVEYINGVKTLVPALWRAYANWQQALEDHAAFFRANPRYSSALLCTTAEDFIQAIATAGYSTDPNYVAKVLSIMQAHQLNTFDVLAT